MAEYINRREATQRIADLVNITRGRCPTWEEVYEALYDLPFIELVRCKDCKYYDYFNGCMSWHDVNSNNDNWYCADGEPKEGK